MHQPLAPQEALVFLLRKAALQLLIWPEVGDFDWSHPQESGAFQVRRSLGERYQTYRSFLQPDSVRIDAFRRCCSFDSLLRACKDV